MKQQNRESRPVLLIVMDGWGIGDGGDADAIAQAHTPNIDAFYQQYPHTQLLTHGAYVGLPAANDLGGSEVGHLTMGAGCLLDQGPTRINKAMLDGSFYQSENMTAMIDHVLEHQSCLHLLGLLSDGNIHSHIDHFIGLIQHAHQQGVQRVCVHALLDGRDVGVQSAQDYIAQLEKVFTDINQADDRCYAIVSGGGREYMSMDRDNDWAKVQRGWQAHVLGKADLRVRSAMQAIEQARAEQPDVVDQDLPGFVVVDAEDQAIGCIHDHDAVVMMNFRADRAIELTEAFCLPDFQGFDRQRYPQVFFVGMMVYDEDRGLPQRQLLGPAKPEFGLGRLLVERGIRQFRLTETQKYPHVTFFFNGGYREPLDAALEDYILLPSDKGVSFADHPQMQAAGIADKAIELLQTSSYGFGLINFANADMVGHCGHLPAAIQAVEAVDTAVGRIIAALHEVGGAAIITADHGNADQMTIANKAGVEMSTKHSINPVPCIVVDSRGATPVLWSAEPGDPEQTPGLSHLAATVLRLMDEPVPAWMNRSLFVQ